MAIFSWKMRRPNRAFWWAAGTGLVAGGVAGWLVFGLSASPRLSALESKGSNVVSTQSTSTAPQVQIVPVGQSPSSAFQTPPQSLTHRLSSVLGILKKTAASAADTGFVGEDREIGQAVAVTSDGWLAVPAAEYKNFRTTDLLVRTADRTYAVTQAVRDTATDAVFLKIAAADLPVVAFVDPQEVEAGMGVWMEPASGRFALETLMDVRSPSVSDPVSSERAMRRYLVSGDAVAANAGGAVWDENGRLIGLLESKARDGWRVMPANDLHAALTSLLADGVIRHAVLGVRGVDLGRVAVDTGARSLPTRGVLIRADKKTGLPAVVPNGPAAKTLREGDVIERIERDMLDGSADLGEILLAYKPGTAVTVEGRRNGVAFQVSVTLGQADTGETMK